MDMLEAYRKGGPRVDDRGFVRTVTGKRLFVNPVEFEGDDDELLEAVACGLSRQPRYAGQYQNCFNYFVAQHAIIGSYLCEPEWALEFLHHDDHEALGLPDTLFDWKREMRRLQKDRRLAIQELAGDPDPPTPFDECSDRVQAYVYGRFGLRWPLPVSLKQIDDQMHECEVHRLFDDAHMPEGHTPPYANLIKPIASSEKLEDMFIARHHELRAQRYDRQQG